MVRLLAWLGSVASAVVAGAGCSASIGVCYSEGGMTRGDDRALAIYTERLFQPLPSGDVAAVELGRGEILAARVSPCDGKDGWLHRAPPESVTSVTFDPPTLARFESSRFDDDLIRITFTALAEGDGTITVRAVFDGDEVEDTRAFRVRALGDFYYQALAAGDEAEYAGPLVAGTRLAAFIYPTTVTGEPLVARAPGAGWNRPDGLLGVTEWPWSAEANGAVTFPVAGSIPIRRGTSSDWSYERTIEATSIEVVATNAIASATLAETSIPATATSCPIGQGFIASTTLADSGGRVIHGGAALVAASDPNALEIHLQQDADDLFVRCKVSGDYRLDLALAGTPKSLMVHIP
jgi:hypothetical protein